MLTVIAQSSRPTDGEGLPIAAPSPFGGVLLAAGVVVLLVWTWISLRRRLRRSAASPDASERLEEIRTRQRGRDSLDGVMVDAEELARRLAAHLDNKAARLEILLDEANATIARLEQAAASGGTARRQIGADIAPSGSAPDPIVRNIYRLADAGKAPLEIATELDEQVGKVELVLALRDA
ncbi:MAG: hypothetical protein ACF8QF_07260 [Phycisphaerales bacterium]